MINKITVKNFKSLKHVENISLGNINLFTGMNGVGKSSLIQILLLLRQSFLKENHNDYLRINGDLIRLGIADDIICEFRSSNYIEFTFNEVEKLKYQYDSNEGNAEILKIDTKPSSAFWESKLFSDQFEYVSAERIGPRVFYENQKEYGNNRIGNKGEYAIQRLSKLIEQDYKIELEDLAHPNTYDEDSEEFDLSILKQVNAWLSEISPNVEIKVEVDNRKGINFSGFRFEEQRAKKGISIKDDNFYSAINVGFGLTYVLPVILAILTAQKGSIIIIENPESHLHPKGQSRLAKLMAIAANSAAQLLVETHSDHIFYGLRVAIKDGFLDAEKAKVLFFHRVVANEVVTNIDIINIDSEGQIDEYPRSFFDEYEINLRKLI